MRMRVLIGLSILILAAAPILVAGGDVKAGKAVYDKKCAACHGPQGEGKPAIAKSLKIEVRHLGSKEVQAKTDAQLRKDTLEGIGKMKGVSGLSEQDVADVIAYMRGLAKK